MAGWGRCSRGFEFGADHVNGLEIAKASKGPVPTGGRVAGASRDTCADVIRHTVFGMICRRSDKGSAQWCRLCKKSRGSEIENCLNRRSFQPWDVL